MDEKPAMSGQSISSCRRRRWFQFRLRSLLILMAICCAGASWVGAEVRIIRERDGLRQRFPPINGYWADSLSRLHPVKVSWVRRILGDEAEVWFVLRENASEEDVNRVKAAFPEASVDKEPLL